MEKLTTTKHWTEKSTDDFLYKLAADFVQQVENYLGEATQTELAKKLNVSPSRVSQVLNNPGNLTLRKIIEYARAIGKKVAIVAYDDNDPENVKGLVNAQVFERCWENAGRPADFFAIDDATTVRTYVLMPESHMPLSVTPQAMKSNTSGPSYGTSHSAGTDADKQQVNITGYVGATNG